MSLKLFISDFFKKLDIIHNNILNKKFDEINKFGDYVISQKEHFSSLSKEDIINLAQLLNLYLYSLEVNEKKNEYINLSKLIITLDKDNMIYYTNYANLLQKVDKKIKAMGIYKYVISIEDNYISYLNLSQYYSEVRDYQISKKYFKKCLSCIPIEEKNNIPLILNDMALLYYSIGNYDKYLLYSYNALIFKIAIENKVNIIGRDLLKIKDMDIIKTCLNELLDQYPKYKILQTIISFLIPEYYENNDEMDKHRRFLENNLNKLFNNSDLNILTENIDLTLLNKIKIGLPLSYQNKDNINLNYKIGVFYKKIFKKYHTLARHVKINESNTKNNTKIKVGFISTNFFNHSVGKDRRGIINKLDKSKFEIYIFTDKEPIDYISKYIKNSSDHFILFNNNLEEAQKKIADCKLDILVYADIGMDIRTYCIGLGKLAKIQIATWGHSDTSGLKNIDYFVSSEYFETEDSEFHYTEKLVKMKSLGTYYFEPHTYLSLPNFNSNKTRLKFGLPLNLNMYLVPHTLFKIHEEYDDIIKSILENDPNGFVVFISGNKNKLKELLFKRLNKNLGKFINNVRFVPMQEELSDFLQLLDCSDIILDSYPFGGCNSSFEAFSLGKIVITRPGNFINGRFTYGLYKKMEIEDAISYSNSSFVKKANYYAQNKKERQKLEKLILDNKNKIFETQDAVDEWNEFLSQITSS